MIPNSRTSFRTRVVLFLVGAASWAGASEETKGEPWSYEASVYAYVTEDEDYLQPTLAADRGKLHLEARYNYEAIDTGSVWIGGNFDFGKDVAFTITPMLGGVFGATKGLAAGYEASLSWWKLELTTEGEYLFDADDSNDNFFYSWSELTLAPNDWLFFGLAAQRTKIYATDSEFSPGVLVGATFGMVDLSAYIFDPDEDNPTYVFAVTLSF